MGSDPVMRSTAARPAVEPGKRGAFTLVEMLVVIGIIGIIAAMVVGFILPKAQQSRLNTASAELYQMETAISSYHADFGVYPPDNSTALTRFQTWNITHSDYLPPLFYELNGAVINTTANGAAAGTYGSGQTQISRDDYSQYFGLAGPQNSSPASLKSYLPGLRNGQFKRVNNVLPYVYVLTCSIGTPTSDSDPNINPWGYNSSNPTNNPGSFDLFNTNILIGSKYYQIGNWSK